MCSERSPTGGAVVAALIERHLRSASRPPLEFAGIRQGAYGVLKTLWNLASFGQLNRRCRRRCAVMTFPLTPSPPDSDACTRWVPPKKLGDP
jgi:hypothetical protein